MPVSAARPEHPSRVLSGVFSLRVPVHTYCLLPVPSSQFGKYSPTNYFFGGVMYLRVSLESQIPMEGREIT